MIEMTSDFNYIYTRNEKSNFKFDESVVYQYGDYAMDFAFDKYLIIEDKDTGVLTRVRTN